MLEAMPPGPLTPSWRFAQLKKAQGQLYFLFAECVSLPVHQWRHH